MNPLTNNHQPPAEPDDLSPAGFKGGQGRSAQDVEDIAAGLGVVLLSVIVSLIT